jgi:aspartate kinase
VLKKDQVLIHLRSKDYSFVGEQGVARLYNILSHLHVQANLLQTGAVILQICIDQVTEKIDQLVRESSNYFDVEVERGLTLLTIRHYQKDLLDKMTAGRKIVLQQWSPETVQTLMY